MNIMQIMKGRQARKKGLQVVFTSDKRKHGVGAKCTAECIDPVPSTTTSTTESPSSNLGKVVDHCFL